MQELLGHLAYKLVNAQVNLWPFPHIYVENIFPEDFYANLLANLPPAGDYTSGSANYNGRKFASPNKNDTLLPFLTEEFTQIASAPFREWIKKRFSSSKFPSYTDLRLIRDEENYKIGPHTDAPWKVLSYLFYLPSDNSLSQYGTSIYLPNDPDFRCKGGPHHPSEHFYKIYTAPFVPNSLFAFFKTDFSFHGVEKITVPICRNLLLWNLYDSVAKKDNP